MRVFSTFLLGGALAASATAGAYAQDIDWQKVDEAIGRKPAVVVGARKPVTVDITSNNRRLAAKCLVDLLPIDVLGTGASRRRRRQGASKQECG